ncbi:histidine kinase [Nonomuraea africana]|uniref:Signal transduction histidine kinase n=1 Tax=Nonomuraea africana TaxID=46171 RepID=A0ABR9KVV0_9ACTN|nr:histidine kinase [Nonomuraea africana]MBE1566161.1 signal transduction histidine kinase [Nonomuraea africana]
MPQNARLITFVVLGGFAGIYVVAGSPLALVVFAAQAAFVVHRRWWLPVVVAVAAYTSVLTMGTSVGILGFAAGSLLLTRLWPLAPAVAVSAALLGPADPTISAVLIALIVYGLTRLTDRVGEVHATRLALAMTAVAEERLRIAAELNEGLGRALAVIADSARAGRPDVDTARRALADARAAAASFRAMSLTPEITTARAMLAAEGITAEVRVGHHEPLGPAGALLAAVLRETVTEVVRRRAATSCLIETAGEEGTVRLRVSHDGARTAEAQAIGDLPARIEEAGGTIVTSMSAEGRLTVEAVLPDTRPAPERDGAYALSLTLLAAVLAGFSLKGLLLTDHVWVSVALLAVICFLQLRSVTGRHMTSLAVMTVLTYAPLPFLGMSWLGVAGFLAGPVLLAFPWKVALPLVGAVLASVAWAGTLLALPAPVTVNYTVSALVTGLVVYGLVRLAQVVKELVESRQVLARSAVVEERLRAARDLHDLLGHNLAAILLTCELARRLDPEAAWARLDEVPAMVERAERDLRAVSGDAPSLSLAAEADSARAVLEAAGISVMLDLGHGELGEPVETVLSTVLRESVTNVLRHSSARHCAITTTRVDGVARLRVRNDGVSSAAGRPGSSGIGNLTTRLAALEGRLATVQRQDWFELTAEAPALTWTRQARPAAGSSAPPDPARF